MGDKLLKPGTRRHNICSLPSKAIRVILNEGWRGFLLKSWNWIITNIVDKGRNCIEYVFRKYLSCSFRRKRIRIAALTMVYNEALILPYFLRHYQYLDEIHVLYETDSMDETLDILNQAKNVVIEKCHIEGGLDDLKNINLINNTLHDIKADWVYVVDPDEFIFPLNESPYDFLKRQNYDVVRAAMFQVYRHRTDKDLDPRFPPIPQRIHGDPDLFSTVQEPNQPPNAAYIKPNVVRPSSRIRFDPGKHKVKGNQLISRECYMGAHWNMADPSIALRRRMEQKARMSETNKAHQLGRQNFGVTEERIRAICERHLDDPLIDALCSFSEEWLPKSDNPS